MRSLTYLKKRLRKKLKEAKAKLTLRHPKAKNEIDRIARELREALDSVKSYNDLLRFYELVEEAEKRVQGFRVLKPSPRLYVELLERSFPAKMRGRQHN